MKFIPSLFALATVIVCQPRVFAFEPAETIKVNTILKTETSWDGQPLTYPEGQAEITGMIIELAPGAETGWHSHPVPSFGVLMEGELEVTLLDGQKKLIKAGEAIAEVVNTVHNGRNVGDSPVKILVFYAGATDLPITVREQNN
ncbi:cupin domain-containing protein [Synechocystis sp. FACHB-383]|uniref:cupin domain-containing protein n=1 Tax=Synechocystis sp. FACHB-383 TaxID=2692864 RepID=UPI001683B7D0|nr:cupin domain-containing protein [Synechocystis sp. FACHB-383]MBD2653483.1 cupin domain-containing protein [Synechocystis sp. FACHB-383]